MIILLPPSEGKAEGGKPGTSWDPASGAFGPVLAGMRAEVASSLKKAKGGDQKLLGVKGDVLARAQEENRSIVGSPVLPAWQRYTGVVWDHLDLASMSAADRRTALRSILVPGGAMGLVRGDDPVPAYKLKMGASVPPMGKLSTWWRPAVTAAVAKAARGTAIVDLLPQEHAAAVEWSALSNVVHVELVARAGGAVGGHFAKAAKGLLARWLLENADSGVSAAVKSFRNPDYAARVR